MIFKTQDSSEQQPAKRDSTLRCHRDLYLLLLFLNRNFTLDMSCPPSKPILQKKYILWNASIFYPDNLVFSSFKAFHLPVCSSAQFLIRDSITVPKNQSNMWPPHQHGTKPTILRPNFNHQLS